MRWIEARIERNVRAMKVTDEEEDDENAEQEKARDQTSENRVNNRKGLEEQFAQAEQDYEWALKILDEPRLAGILDQIESEMEQAHERLVEAESKEVPRLQAQIKTSRAILGRLRAESFGRKVDEARKMIEDYDREHPLFAPRVIEGAAKAPEAPAEEPKKRGRPRKTSTG